MKKSIFGAGLMFLGALLLIAPTRVPDGSSGSPTPAAAPSSPTPAAAPSSPPPVAAQSSTPSLPPGVSAIVVDSVGDNVGLLFNIVWIPGDNKNCQIVVKPPTVNKSQVYYPVSSASPTPPPPTVLLTVPVTLQIVFCSGTDSYAKGIGRCANGQAVSKIIPISSVADPAAQTPTGASCYAPLAPTWDSWRRTWNCIKAPGFPF